MTGAGTNGLIMAAMVGKAGDWASWATSHRATSTQSSRATRPWMLRSASPSPASLPGPASGAARRLRDSASTW